MSARRARPGGARPEVVILDAEGRIVAVNKPWRKATAACGIGPGMAGVGAFYAEAARQVVPDIDCAALEISLRRLLSGAVDEVRQTFPIHGCEAGRWRQVQITRMSSAGARCFVAVHDEQLRPATPRQAHNATSAQLSEARDDERQRIAIELHDSTSQHLAAISMGLARLRRTHPPAAQAEVLDEIAASVDEVIKETRVLSYLMKPRALEQSGLSATTRKFLDGLARRTGLEVALAADAAVDAAPLPLQHAALRIVQEALMNASRHAHAGRVWVDLVVERGRLRVTVADDGHGMRPDGGEPSFGVGIPGMQARARQFGGDLAITSNESGTRIVATFRLRAAAQR